RRTMSPDSTGNVTENPPAPGKTTGTFVTTGSDTFIGLSSASVYVSRSSGCASHRRFDASYLVTRAGSDTRRSATQRSIARRSTSASVGVRDAVMPSSSQRHQLAFDAPGLAVRVSDERGLRHDVNAVHGVT